MLDVPLSKRRIQRFYSTAAPVYDEHTVEHEAEAKRRAVDLLDRHPGERYLEVALGTGMTFAEITGKSGLAAAVGVDMAPGMIDVARRRLRDAGSASAPFALADARALPFPDTSFDCLFNSYMLDLIPTAEIPLVLAEFLRVLRPGARLVLVNLTEGEGEDVAFSDGWKERYREDPEQLGGCRPVRVTPDLRDCGFTDVERTYVGHGDSWPSEILTARRPG